MLTCSCGAVNFLIDIHDINNWYSCFTIIFSQCFKGMIFSSGYHHNRQKKFFFYQSLTDTIRPDIGGEPFREIVTASQKLEIKLNKKYEKQIKIEKGNTISGNIVYSSLMTFNDSRRWKQTIKEICISSISQDTVYAATSGLKKP